MENFFLYISKPVDNEDLQLWIDKNNICFNKFDLYRDFVSSLISLIYETYLGDDVNNSTNIILSAEDDIKHFEWCWERTISNFRKENIEFNNTGEHHEFFKGFILETFYNQNIDAVKFSLNRFFDEIFNLDGLHTMSDLDLLKQVYVTLDKNLENNNLHN
jgi:hypothetical protein